MMHGRKNIKLMGEVTEYNVENTDKISLFYYCTL